MKILWFTWKDRSHPLAGGAEVVAHEIARRLVRDGHQVRFIVAGYEGCTPSETTTVGYEVIRLGNRFSVYWCAWRYYRTNLKGWADHVIDELNAIPFFAKWYVREPVTLFVHHITGSGWLHQISFPLNVVGYLLEPLMLRLLSNMKTITVSESTRQELYTHGFSSDQISIIPEGTDCKPVSSLEIIQKYPVPTLIFVGGIRPLKRPIDVIKAFECAKKELPDLELKIAGPLDDGGTGYGATFLRAVEQSAYAHAIMYLGRISFEQKKELMQRAHIICVTSRKEGWGLIVTEANSQGTPAIVYNVPGLRDSTRDGVTGVICKENTPQALATEIVALVKDKNRYATLQRAAWEWSKEHTFENTYRVFTERIF